MSMLRTIQRVTSSVRPDAGIEMPVGIRQGQIIDYIQPRSPGNYVDTTLTADALQSNAALVPLGAFYVLLVAVANTSVAAVDGDLMMIGSGATMEFVQVYSSWQSAGNPYSLSAGQYFLQGTGLDPVLSLPYYTGYDHLTGEPLTSVVSPGMVRLWWAGSGGPMTFLSGNAAAEGDTQLTVNDATALTNLLAQNDVVNVTIGEEMFTVSDPSQITGVLGSVTVAFDAGQSVEGAFLPQIGSSQAVLGYPLGTGVTFGAADDDTPLVDVPFAETYYPQQGDTVWVVEFDHDVIVLCKTQEITGGLTRLVGNSVGSGAGGVHASGSVSLTPVTTAPVLGDRLYRVDVSIPIGGSGGTPSVTLVVQVALGSSGSWNTIGTLCNDRSFANGDWDMVTGSVFWEAGAWTGTASFRVLASSPAGHWYVNASNTAQFTIEVSDCGVM